MFEVSEFYVDATEVVVTDYTVILRMSVLDKVGPNERPRPVAIVRMSPEHAKVSTMMLRKSMKDRERAANTTINVNPEILNRMGLSLEDW